MISKPITIPKRTKRITSEWLNGVLHNTGFLKDVNIDSISREPWGVGEGFVSDMARLTISYDKDSPELSKTMIVKMPTTFRTTLDVALQYNFYEKEIRFYTEVAPKSPIRVPSVIYSDYDSDTNKYILILEDCSCYKMVDQLIGLNYEQTKQAIITIADFHGRWWNAPDLFSFDWMSKPRGKDSMALIDTFRNSWDFAIKNEEFLEILPEGALEIGEELYKQFPWLLVSGRDDNLTIIHYDYRADNMFFDAENSENPIITIDWTSPIVTNGMMDIAYLLAESIKTDLRRQIEEEMIRFYLKCLEENGITSYDFDMAWHDYLRSLNFYAYLPPLGVTLGDLSDPRGMDLYKAITKRLYRAIIDNDATSIFPS
ncbi:MAG: phosphotransferase [Promethearchaeota archaeon]|jgi:hypothetical protein